MRFTAHRRAVCLGAALLAAPVLAACSGDESTHAQGGEAAGTEAQLSLGDVSGSCYTALDTLLTSDNYGHTVMYILPGTGETPAPGHSTFDGQLEAYISSPAYNGEFTFHCITDGEAATVDAIGLPHPGETTEAARTTANAQAPTTRRAAPSAGRAAPTPRVAPPVDPSRIDPHNDPSGRSGMNDNLGIYYHNSVDWEWLKYPELVSPGVRIYNATTHGSCSAGFIASRGDRLFLITAAHCGNRGDQFLIQNRQGQQYVFGEMVESYLEQDARGSITGADIGLIELYDDAKQYVSSALPTSSKLQGWLTPQEAAQRGMAFCRLGATTGYSCGKFGEIGNNGLFYYRNINDRGDSGGVIFALDDSGAWAVGVSSNVSDTNKTYAGGMEIAGAIQHWGLTLHG